MLKEEKHPLKKLRIKMTLLKIVILAFNLENVFLITPLHCT